MEISDIAAADIDIPTPRLKDSGLTGDDGPEDDAQDPEATNQMRLGFILDEPDDKKVADHVHDEIDEQEPEQSRRRAIWKRSRWWREGKRWVRLVEKKENRSVWEAKLPPGMRNAPPVPNKTDRLCRRVVNVVWVDEPYVECEPGDDSNEARDAAEFSSRYLAIRFSPSELNLVQLGRRALGKAMTYASSFAWVITDPTKGGHRPRTVLAHPAAETQDTAEFDPETGGAAPEESLKQRYVRPDQTLTDNPAEADLQWLPGHKVRLLTGNNVLLLPSDAYGVREANGVIIIDHTTLGELKTCWPEEMAALKDEELDDLCKWKPAKHEDLLRPGAISPKDQKTEDGKWKDSQTVWVCTVYYRQCAEYPKGCYAIIGGKDLVLYRDTWTAMMPQPATPDGQPQPDKEEVLEVPVAQQRCLDDDNSDDGYGHGLAEFLGPADEIRASSLGYQMEYMFRFGNPIPMLPMGTIVQPKQMMLRDGNPIYFNPQGQPTWEEVPPLPAIVPELRQEMAEEMNDESGLQQTGQGVESSDVHSGVHARTVVQEALKAISNIKSNSEFFIIDLARILLEQTRAFCSLPTILEYQTPAGSYKAKEWDRTSFRTTKKVSIKRGSFTMHTLTAKQEMANEAYDRKVIDAEDYSEMTASGVSPILGNQDNPHLMRVRSQLDKWTDGPTPEWSAAFQAVQQATMANEQATQEFQAMQAYNPGAVLPPPPLVPPPPMPPGPFEPALPIDDEPMPAKIRHRQLSRAMADPKFGAMPPEWQALLVDAYQKAKASAGVMTVGEVQAGQKAEAAARAKQAMMPKVSISMKGDESNIAQEEMQAAAGAEAASGGAAPQPAPDGASQPQPEQQQPTSRPPMRPPGAPPKPIPGI